MIEQRMNQMARSLRRELCAKNLLCDREAMTQVENDHDEFIRFYAHMNVGRSREVPDETSRVADLLPMYFNKGLPVTLRLSTSAEAAERFGIKIVGDEPHVAA
jgi:hypothetical protein